MKWVSQEFKNGAMGEKWVRVKWKAFSSGLVLLRPRKWESLGGFWTDRPRRKNRPGAFTNSEKAGLVEFGTQCVFPLIPLSFWVCSGTPGRIYLLGKDWCLTIIPSFIPGPTIGPLVDFLFLSLSLATILSIGEGHDKMSSKLFNSTQRN